MPCFVATITVLAAIAAFIAPAANASPVSAGYQPTKNICDNGKYYNNARPYGAEYNTHAYPYGGANNAYSNYGGANSYGNVGNYGGANSYGNVGNYGGANSYGNVGNYGGVGTYGGVGSYGSYGSGLPFALSTVNKLDSDSFAANYKDNTVYANNKDASVSKDQVSKFDSVNVIA
ncbi:hypothetical protein GGF37_001893 [Kickxella alabastrina]|nr:hypothetical protein GGF37_001893 [Kickxella alabastrina]